MTQLSGYPTEAEGPSRPRDSAEFITHDAWCVALQSSEIPVRADFFSLGGTSLAAWAVITRIASATGVKLPISAVYEAPTIEGMAALVRTPGNRGRRCRTMMREGAGVGPVVFLHPIGGSVIWYSEVVANLPPAVTCLGFDAVGLDPAMVPHRSIAEMASAYLYELEGHEMPVLVGYSLGGLIAYEMASQAAARGTAPRGLVLVDAQLTPPGQGPPTAGRLLESFVGHALGLHDLLDGLAELGKQELVQRILTEAQSRGAVPPDFDEERLARVIELYEINGAAGAAYRPGPYQGPVLLLRPASGTPDDGVVQAWHEVCGRCLDVMTLSGSHGDMLAGAGARRSAEIIAATLSSEPGGGAHS